MQEITNYIAAKSAKAREKKSMRVSVIVHIIILILAMLPFLSMKPDPGWQTIKVTFEEPPVDFSSSSSNAGAKKSSSSESSTAESLEEVQQEEVTPVEELVVEEFVPHEVAEVKPLESTPVVTSPSDAPALPNVKEVNVKIPVPTPDPIPKKRESKKINSKVQKTDIPIKEVKVTKPAVEPAKVPTKISTSGGKTSGGDGKIGAGTSGKSNRVGNGSGKSDAGDGKTDGQGQGDSGTGDDFFGSGFGSGSGDGVFDGDGILTRTIVRQPSLAHLISESGVFAVNVCVNRKGKVTFLEYNEKHSTIKDKGLVREALSAAGEYLFESKASAPTRECGLVKIKIKIRR